MNIQKFPKLFFYLQHNGKFSWNFSSGYLQSSKLFTTGSKQSIYLRSNNKNHILLPNDGRVTTVSNIFYEYRRPVDNRQNLQLSQNLNIFRKTAKWDSNLLFVKRTSSIAACPNIIGIRHSSDLPEIRVAMPEVFNNSFIKAISESSGVELIMNQLQLMHDYTGLPWPLTIFIVTLMFRLAVFPLAILQERNIAKLQRLQKDLQKIQDEIRLHLINKVERGRLYSSEVPFLYKSAVKEEYDKLIVKENCHPLRGHVSLLLQLPLWISVTIALRNMCCMAPKYDEVAYHVYQQLSIGGFAWISNLTDYDHFYALPVLIAVMNIATGEIHSLVMTGPKTKFYSFRKYFSRGINIVIVPLVAHMPSFVLLYWLSNSFFTSLQTLLFLSPKCRRLLRIPHTEYELKNPYTHLWQEVCKKLRVNRVSNIR